MLELDCSKSGQICIFATSTEDRKSGSGVEHRKHATAELCRGSAHNLDLDMKIDAADVQAKCVSFQTMNALKAAAICVQLEGSIKKHEDVALCSVLRPIPQSQF
jgi:hypothetical protein